MLSTRVIVAGGGGVVIKKTGNGQRRRRQAVVHRGRYAKAVKLPDIRLASELLPHPWTNRCSIFFAFSGAGELSHRLVVQRSVLSTGQAAT